MASNPPVSSHGVQISSDSIAATVPNSTTSAKVRKLALAASSFKEQQFLSGSDKRMTCHAS